MKLAGCGRLHRDLASHLMLNDERIKRGSSPQLSIARLYGYDATALIRTSAWKWHDDEWERLQ